MIAPARSLTQFVTWSFALPAVFVAGCGHDSVTGPREIPPNALPSAAYDAWKPGSTDTCPLSVHQKYTTVGPDGKLYPTWHPPVDLESGCTFGHEHGRDPHGSNLYALVNDIPFGYANEVLDTWDPNGKRHEDHYGHKIEWENDVRMDIRGAGKGLFEIHCDFLTKLHQGTHSKDAFTNNLHEIVYHIKCTDGTEVHITAMAAIGTGGEFTRGCDGNVHVHVGDPNPANSPSGGGQRVIPDLSCVQAHVLVGPGQRSDFFALHESWQTGTDVRTDNGRGIAGFNPYYQVNRPSRFHDPTNPAIVGRPVLLCFPSATTNLQARGGPCDDVDITGAALNYDDLTSPFNGVSRFVDMNSIRVDNADGPEVWFTDPFGHHANTSAFPGSIRQFIAKINNTGVDFSGPRIGDDRNYGGRGVHAPN